MTNTSGIIVEGPQLRSSGVAAGQLYTILEPTPGGLTDFQVMHRHEFDDTTAPKIASIELTDLDRVFTNIDRTSSGEATWLITFDERVEGCFIRLILVLSSG